MSSKKDSKIINEVQSETLQNGNGIKVPVNQKMAELDLEKDYIQTLPACRGYMPRADPESGSAGLQCSCLAPAEYCLPVLGQILSRQHLTGHWTAKGLTVLSSAIHPCSSHTCWRVGPDSKSCNQCCGSSQGHRLWHWALPQGTYHFIGAITQAT